jgi:hypothetical protein
VIAVASTAAGFRAIARDVDRALDRVAERPEVKRETAYYLANISKVRSIDDLMADRRLLAFALEAHGLADMAYAKGLVRRALVEGVDNNRSLANRLVDPRWRDFVTTFNFARNGAATTSFTRAKAGTVERYERQALEEQAGAQNAGVRLALYFQRKAPEATSAIQVLADKALSEVVRTTLGIPAATAALPLDRQIALLESRLDFSTFRDSDKLGRFLDRFSARWDMARAGEAGSAASPFTAAVQGGGLTGDTLLRLQRLRTGGA